MFLKGLQSTACGYGYRHRKVTCQQLDGTTVDNELCSPSIHYQVSVILIGVFMRDSFAVCHVDDAIPNNTTLFMTYNFRFDCRSGCRNFGVGLGEAWIERPEAGREISIIVGGSWAEKFAIFHSKLVHFSAFLHTAFCIVTNAITGEL